MFPTYFLYACWHGYWRGVLAELPRATPDEVREGFRLACLNGDLEGVALLSGRLSGPVDSGLFGAVCRRGDLRLAQWLVARDGGLLWPSLFDWASSGRLRLRHAAVLDWLASLAPPQPAPLAASVLRAERCEEARAVAAADAEAPGGCGCRGFALWGRAWLGRRGHSALLAPEEA